MNLVSLIGRVVKEVEVQQLQPSGKSVFNNTIAVQNVYRNNDDSYHSHFIQVVAWGKIAERIGKFVKKGGPDWCGGKTEYASLYEQESSRSLRYRSRY